MHHQMVKQMFTSGSLTASVRAVSDPVNNTNFKRMLDIWFDTEINSAKQQHQLLLKTMFLYLFDVEYVW